MQISVLQYCKLPPMVRRFSIGSLWTFLGNISWRGFSALSTVLVARILEPNLFGEFSMVWNTVVMFGVCADFHMGATSAKYVSEYRQNAPEKAARILKLVLTGSLIFCFLIGFTLFAFAPYIATAHLQRPQIKIPLMIGALLLFLLIYGNVIENSITGFEAFKKIAATNALKGVLTPLLVIPSAYYFGVKGAVAGTAGVSAVMLIPLLIALRREMMKANFPKQTLLKDCLKEKSIIWLFALPGFLTGLIMMSMQWYSRVLLTQQTNGYFELGLFGAADQWRTLVLFLPAVLSRVVLPILSDTYGNHNKEFGTIVSFQFQVVLAIALPLTIGSILFAKPLASIYGNQYNGVDLIIPLLSGTAFFFSLNQSLQTVFDGSGKRWIGLGLYVSWGLILIISCFVLVPFLKAKGLALSLLLAQIFVFFAQCVVIEKKIARSSMQKHFGELIFAVSILSIAIYMQLYCLETFAIIINSFLLVISFYPAKKLFIFLSTHLNNDNL